MITSTEHLHQVLFAEPLLRPPCQSRVHPLRSFDYPGVACFVKREDEVGFGISGTKLRKYFSLFPRILEEKPDMGVLTGGASSNHVVSMAQLLREHGIEPVAFLLGDPSLPLQGNLLWIHLLIKPENIHWVPRNGWSQLDTLAQEYAEKKKQEGVIAAVIPKGGSGVGALKGSATLALDIVRNERELGMTFDHLIIDTGTGLTACALLHALAYLGKSCEVHMVQMAGTKEEWEEMLKGTHQEWEDLIQAPSPFPTRFSLHVPRQAPSFGSVNRQVLQTVIDLARGEGFLTDPVFTAKLFSEGRALIQENSWKGNILFIHSGGALGLSGFSSALAAVIS